MCDGRPYSSSTRMGSNFIVRESETGRFDSKVSSYDMKHCHILGRGDLKANARTLPLDQLKLHHILLSVLDYQQREDAQLVVVKVSSTESVTLKDTLSGVN